jgi:hypothetical protein
VCLDRLGQRQRRPGGVQLARLEQPGKLGEVGPGRSGAAARQASSENPDTVFNGNRLVTGTLVRSPAAAP